MVRFEQNSIPIKSLGYRIFFLGEGDYDVEVFETRELDFDEIEHRLQNGQSIFIDSIKPAKIVNHKVQAFKNEGSWYFARL